tara:strand:+ start:1279 stop:1410 length:132 start_codon:yes stop_codon:yes gene_type:complete
MPVYLRKFYYGKLVDAKKLEKEQIDKVKQKSTIQRPQIPRFNR